MARRYGKHPEFPRRFTATARVTEKTYLEFKQAARERGLTLSDYILGMVRSAQTAELEPTEIRQHNA